ncbi:MAG: hypothetical protein A2284_17430 [Deltaproteobacteria bacterium RIFOXYA12_FULL_61_11]|nr:MAG: hypothetical protein A2284_17430 [Deltaproteobacteria bacterium RIFOXYA12_FULL_61_11]
MLVLLPLLLLASCTLRSIEPAEDASQAILPPQEPSDDSLVADPSGDPATPSACACAGTTCLADCSRSSDLAPCAEVHQPPSELMAGFCTHEPLCCLQDPDACCLPELKYCRPERCVDGRKKCGREWDQTQQGTCLSAGQGTDQPPGSTTTCPAKSSRSYAALRVSAPAPGAERNPEINLALRGFTRVEQDLRLVAYGPPAGEPPDPKAPQLGTILGRGADFTAAYQVHQWDWERQAPKNEVETAWPVSLLGLRAEPGQGVLAPRCGYDLGNGAQYLVLYASTSALTLTVNGADTAIDGYTVHLEGFCADPALLARYRELDAAGRIELPAVRGGEVLGTAGSNEVKVAVRDSGSYMDPRSKGDWWQDTISAPTDPELPDHTDPLPDGAPKGLPPGVPVGSCTCDPTICYDDCSRSALLGDCPAGTGPDPARLGTYCWAEPVCCTNDPCACCWAERKYCKPETCAGCGQRCGVAWTYDWPFGCLNLP